MKKIIILLLGIVLTFNVNAQWYNTRGVININELNKVQLNLAMEKTVKTIKIGQNMTLIGIGTAIIGGFMYTNSSDATGSFFGYTLLYGGALTTSIGIPLWISGTTRKSAIEIALKKYDSAYLNGIGVGLKFAF